MKTIMILNPKLVSMILLWKEIDYVYFLQVVEQNDHFVQLGLRFVMDLSHSGPFWLQRSCLHDFWFLQFLFVFV